jgi:S-DNA-T family DNA segregation ATPase FtsK/SpoIIIE
VAAETGPVVTMFELELAAGVKVSQIASLANDMARALGVGAVRVVAPLPGKHTIGIEVPNSEKEKVRIKNMMELAGSKPQKMQIPLYLGKDSSGEALVSDLTKMPHLLIAGTTGSGKSVCINSVIVGVLLTKRPDEVKMILIDPKMVEMTAFNTIPHLMCPIVTETQMAVQILEWATVKMDERYALLAEARVKNITEFNKLDAEELTKRFNPSTPEEEAKIPKKLPYIVIVIDELADLMMTAAKEIEGYIVRLAQKSRAVGIHIVLATQRPQATVVTGLIKSNMPTRIGFRVAARMDSRIILDQNGAETLLGEGDMLFLKPGTSDLIRAQGTFIDESEIKRIVKHLKEVAEPQFHPELTRLKTLDTSEMVRDELFDDAVRIVLETKRGSVSLLQRRLSIGYARASRIIELMAASGILGEYKGSQAREVIITLEEYERIRDQMNADAEAGYEDLAEDDSPQHTTESEPAYISEGQRGYMSTDSEDD